MLLIVIHKILWQYKFDGEKSHNQCFFLVTKAKQTEKENRNKGDGEANHEGKRFPSHQPITKSSTPEGHPVRSTKEHPNGTPTSQENLHIDSPHETYETGPPSKVYIKAHVSWRLHSPLDAELGHPLEPNEQYSRNPSSK